MAHAGLLERALEVFARGVAYTRGLVQPCEAVLLETAWVIRDTGPDLRRRRNEEWAAHGSPAAALDRLARTHARGPYSLCVIIRTGTPDGPLRAAYKTLGYRLRTTEPLMVHDLRLIRQHLAPAQIERVSTVDLAARLARAARQWPMTPEQLADDSPIRQYAALLNDEPIGWARSVVLGDATWCSSMFVRPEFRRRGIARALLEQMLTDDRAGGSTLAVLLASHAGAKLYPVVGYEQIGTLLFLTPRRGK